MTNTKHSPTPWKIENDGKSISQEGSGNEFISQVNSGFGAEKQKANASFIVTAVNSHYGLLEALKNIRSMADNSGDKCIFEEANEAIAKAEALS